MIQLMSLTLRYIEIDFEVFWAYLKRPISISFREISRMKDCSPSIAPIVKGDRFNLEQCPKNDLEQEQIKNIPYVSTVGSLMYAQVCTRPAIAFVVGMLGRY